MTNLPLPLILVFLCLTFAFQIVSTADLAKVTRTTCPIISECPCWIFVPLGSNCKRCRDNRPSTTCISCRNSRNSKRNFASLVSNLRETNAACALGWTFSSNSCYKYISEQKIWVDAQKDCNTCISEGTINTLILLLSTTALKTHLLPTRSMKSKTYGSV
jgi:hypothetical protein